MTRDISELQDRAEKLLRGALSLHDGFEDWGLAKIPELRGTVAEAFVFGYESLGRQVAMALQDYSDTGSLRVLLARLGGLVPVPALEAPGPQVVVGRQELRAILQRAIAAGGSRPVPGDRPPGNLDAVDRALLELRPVITRPGDCCGMPGPDCTGPCARSYDEQTPEGRRAVKTARFAELYGADHLQEPDPDDQETAP